MRILLIAFFIAPLSAFCQDFIFNPLSYQQHQQDSERAAIAAKYHIKTTTLKGGSHVVTKRDTILNGTLEISSYSYDSTGRATGEETTDGVKGMQTYNANGQPLNYSVDGAVRYENFYDGNGRLIRTVNYVNDTNRWLTDFTYLPGGKIENRKDYSLFYKHYVDYAHRGTKIDSLFMNEYRFDYDAKGKLISVSDMKSQPVRKVYEITYEKDGSVRVDNNYYKCGNYVKYDSLGRLIDMNSCDDYSATNRKEYSYNAKGQLTKLTRNDQYVHNYVTTYFYNVSGQLMREETKDGKLIYYYNKEGLLVKEVSTLSGTLWITKYYYTFYK